VEVENRRLSDEFKFVNPKLDSLFEGEILSCKDITSFVLLFTVQIMSSKY